MTTWIFQGNPKRWMIDEGLRSAKEITWTVNQAHFADEIRVEDEVFIWRSDGGRPGTGGIVALSKVIERPRFMEEDSPRALWVDDSIGRSGLRARLTLLEVRLTPQAGMLRRFDLLNTPQLKRLLILRFANQTNYLVEPAEAMVIRALWDQSRRSR
jgi:5-methylcytosine-specific restriction protein A